MNEIILASASPRRSQLLMQVGIPFEVIPSAYEEAEFSKSPQDTVLAFARGKAKEVLARIGDGRTVLGADTVVACDGRILGKPRSKEQAFDMLKSLQGRSHEVYTGVCLIKKQSEKILEKSFVEETRVDFAPMTDAQIWEYVESGECMDKAGAYGIQGRCAAYITGICGDYNNVVGLPVGRVYRELREF